MRKLYIYTKNVFEIYYDLFDISDHKIILGNIVKSKIRKISLIALNHIALISIDMHSSSIN